MIVVCPSFFFLSFFISPLYGLLWGQYHAVEKMISFSNVFDFLVRRRNERASSTIIDFVLNIFFSTAIVVVVVVVLFLL